MLEYYGAKTDLLFNLGYNVDDRFYFGFNLGIPMIDLGRNDLFYEQAQDPTAHPVIFYDKDDNLVPTNYVSSTNTYKLSTSALGINARFGFIALITESLRLGAAIQTPTAYTVHEKWEYSASSTYENSEYSSSAKSTPGEYEYHLRTPYIVDAGITYTLPGVGLLSIDYELNDYSVCKYSDFGYLGYDEDSWAKENYVNRTFLGVSHSVRAGVEFKPLDFLAVRAGYSFVSDPEKYLLDESGKRVTAEEWKGYGQILTKGGYFDSFTHSVSFGLGYSSSGSFFADLALRLTSYPRNYYDPYYYSYDAVDKDGKLLDVNSPVILLNRSVFDAMLTMGWRF